MAGIYRFFSPPVLMRSGLICITFCPSGLGNETDLKKFKISESIIARIQTTLMPLGAKLETCDGETILISLPKGEEEPLDFGSRYWQVGSFQRHDAFLYSYIFIGIYPGFLTSITLPDTFLSLIC